MYPVLNKEALPSPQVTALTLHFLLENWLLPWETDRENIHCLQRKSQRSVVWICGPHVEILSHLWKWKSLSHVQLFATPWDSPSQNTGVGSFSLLQSIFPTQGLNPGLLHCRQILYQLNHQGSPSSEEISSLPRGLCLDLWSPCGNTH